jgi:hypothetical protein
MTGNEPASVPGDSLPPPPPPEAPPQGGPGLGHVVAGAVLVLIGVGWLLEALGVTDVPWRLLLPAALILVGLALTLGARSGRHGGLVAVGVVLTLAVLFAGAIDILSDLPLSGGIGERDHRPTTQVADAYRWGIGSMTLDLRGADDLAGRHISASVIIGQLVVIVPDDLPLSIHARSGMGEARVLGTTRGGLDANLYCSGSAGALACDDGLPGGEPILSLDLEVAMGRVEVQR